MATTTYVSKLAIQHNQLINARFDMSTNELRIFISMLARLKKGDKEFEMYHIPLKEILDEPSGGAYTQMKEACKTLTVQTIYIEEETDEEDKKRFKKTKKKRRFISIPLMARAEYLEGSAVVEVKFNEEIKPYLLELTANFTVAQIEQLLKLKNSYAYRIYWLLKQYVRFGERVIELEELKHMLTLRDKYDGYADFRRGVLEPAKKALEQTDLHFTYEPIKLGRAVHKIKFKIDYSGGEEEAKLLAAASINFDKIDIFTPDGKVPIPELLEKFGLSYDQVQYIGTHLTPRLIYQIAFDIQKHFIDKKPDNIPAYVYKIYKKKIEQLEELSSKNTLF